MPEIVADGAPFEAPLDAAAEGYAQTPPSTAAFAGSLVGAGAAMLARAGQRGTQADASLFDQAFLQSGVGEAQEEGVPAPPAPVETPILAPEEANARYGPVGPDGKQVPIADAPISEGLAQIVGQQKAEAMEREGIQARYANAHGLLPTLAVGAIASLADPLNAAAMFIPPLGESAIIAALGRAGLGAGFAANTIARAGAGAVTGALVGAGAAGLQLGLAPEEASDYGLKDALREVAYGASGFAALHAGFGAAGDLFRAYHPDAATTHAALSATTAQLADGEPVSAPAALFPASARMWTPNAEATEIGEQEGIPTRGVTEDEFFEAYNRRVIETGALGGQVPFFNNPANEAAFLRAQQRLGLTTEDQLAAARAYRERTIDAGEARPVAAPDVAAFAGAQQQLHRDGFAPGMGDPEFAAAQDAVYGEPEAALSPEQTTSRQTTSEPTTQEAAPAAPGAGEPAGESGAVSASGVAGVPEPAAPAVALALPSAPIAGTPPSGEVRSFRPGDLTVDAKRFQFKEAGDEAGVTNRLQGVERWDPVKAGMALVYEDRAGTNYIVDGHQRLALAQRVATGDAAQDPRLNAIVLREADGVSDADARAAAAAKNIAEGTGSALDAAKVLRDRPELMRDLPPRSELVRQAKGLANLDDESFGMVVNDVVPANYAAIVGRLVPDDPQMQRALVELLAKTEPENAVQAEAIVRQGREAGLETSTQQELFGTREIASSLYLDRARLLDRALRQLRRDRTVFNAIVNEHDVVSALGNVLSRDVNARRATTDAQAIQIIQTLASRKGAVGDALNAAARTARDSGNTAGATRDFVAAIRRQLESGDLVGERDRGIRGALDDRAADAAIHGEPGGTGAPAAGAEFGERADGVTERTGTVERYRQWLDRTFFAGQRPNASAIRDKLYELSPELQAARDETTAARRAVAETLTAPQSVAPAALDAAATQAAARERALYQDLRRQAMAEGERASRHAVRIEPEAEPAARIAPPAAETRAATETKEIIEKTAQGDQRVMPGMEQSAVQAAASREAEGGGRIAPPPGARGAQREPGGLFERPEMPQPGLFDEARGDAELAEAEHRLAELPAGALSPEDHAELARTAEAQRAAGDAAAGYDEAGRCLTGSGL